MRNSFPLSMLCVLAICLVSLYSNLGVSFLFACRRFVVRRFAVKPKPIPKSDSVRCLPSSEQFRAFPGKTIEPRTSRNVEPDA